MKIDWASKLTSRKFWAAIIAFLTAVFTAFGIPNLTIEQVIAIVTAASSLIAYIVGEGLVDAARIKNSESTSSAKETDTPDSV